MLDENCTLPLAGNAFGSVTGSGAQTTEEAFASDEPASPRTIVPHAPSPPSGTTADASRGSPSVDDICGPDRLFGPLLHQAGAIPSFQPAHTSGHAGAHLPQHLQAHEVNGAGTGTSFGAGTAFYAPMGTADAFSGTAFLPALANPGQHFKDALAREASNVTPGIDDAPYILYALDALTGDVTLSTGAAYDDGSASKHSSFPFRHIPDEGLGYYRPRSLPRSGANIGTASIKPPASSSPVQNGLDRHFSARRSSAFEPRAHQPSSPQTTQLAHPTNPNAPRTLGRTST
ncbi:hypothetical protein SCUCBS95973_009156 [Sporothrix curviconia]|uniref:Uncharacterized protein n=1 Tax=Sporothrix curviconia TaxID=1260050 RepID=A0ABP0CSL4_9PEZI